MKMTNVSQKKYHPFFLKNKQKKNDKLKKVKKVEKVKYTMI